MVDHLLSVGDASWIFELDAAKLDKSFTPEVWDAIRMISALIAMCLGLDWRPVAALVVGLQHTHYELKGDVFEANCNPSG